MVGAAGRTRLDQYYLAGANAPDNDGGGPDRITAIDQVLITASDQT